MDSGLSRSFAVSRCAVRYALQCVGIVAAAVMLLPVGEAQAQVGLEPMVIQSEVNRGQAQSVLTVTNPSAQPMRVRVYAQPFTYDRDAGFTLLTEDSDDLTPYLQFSPREFVVPAGERQRVRVVGILPPSLPELEYRAVIFTEALPEGPATGTSTAAIKTRIGSTVYFYQSDADLALSVVSGEWDAESRKIRLLVNNVGDVSVRPNAKWTLRRGGEALASGESGSTTVVEGRDRLLQIAYSEAEQGILLPGEYEITGELVWLSGSEQSSQPFSTSFVIR